MRSTRFNIFAAHKNFFHVLDNLSQAFINVLLKFYELYKEYNSCLISLLSFSVLFPAFNDAKEVGNLLSDWFGVSIFSPCPL